MAITFYYGSGSPYAWRVWLALEHKRLNYELTVLSFSGGDLRTPEFTRLNPRQKVPVLEDGDFVLYESVAILEYLDEQYSQGGPWQAFPAGCSASGYCAAPYSRDRIFGACHGSART